MSQYCRADRPDTSLAGSVARVGVKSVRGGLNTHVAVDQASRAGADRHPAEQRRRGQWVSESDAMPMAGLSADDIWYPTAWIPSRVDQRLAGFAQAVSERQSAAPRTDAPALIQRRVTSSASSRLHSTRRRACLLAPFPRAWSASACSGGGRLLPLISAAEMAIAYVAFAGIPLLLWEFRRQSSLWFVVALCLGALIVHGFIFVNVGTLFRVRYAWFATLVVLGAAGWATNGPRLYRSRQFRVPS